jgi:hypothetical protein
VYSTKTGKPITNTITQTVAYAARPFQAPVPHTELLVYSTHYRQERNQDLGMAPNGREVNGAMVVTK